MLDHILQSVELWIVGVYTSEEQNLLVDHKFEEKNLYGVCESIFRIKFSNLN